ncbi:hypothetical protein TI05_08855 [Achromatium sp. WMS3]|nr:hypothetical protein TI05_08855 [Achromatium sp. WMS3]
MAESRSMLATLANLVTVLSGLGALFYYWYTLPTSAVNHHPVSNSISQSISIVPKVPKPRIDEPDSRLQEKDIEDPEVVYDVPPRHHSRLRQMTDRAFQRARATFRRKDHDDPDPFPGTDDTNRY